MQTPLNPLGPVDDDAKAYVDDGAAPTTPFRRSATQLHRFL